MAPHEDDWRTMATHLVVFQHGLFGSGDDFTNFHHKFQQYFPLNEVYVYTAQCNATSLSSMFATNDGIDRGAERLADEITALAATMPKLTKFSIVGHSLGGLYARYCIGLLYSRGFFEHVDPMNFITLATPHMGIRRPQRGSFNFLYNTVAPRLFDRTGQQFTLNDTASEQTLALSRKVHKYPHRASYAACTDMDGVLQAAVGDRVKARSFEPYICALRHRTLSISTTTGAEAQTNASADEDKGVHMTQERVVMVVDLVTADVIVVLPESTKNEFEPNAIWEIEITDASSDVQCVLQIPHCEIEDKWKWLAALSNSSYGVHCRTTSSAHTRERASGQTLLSCLTRGQFIQALQLFRARSLYASVFFDLQVPYSCGAIRAFNPYRADESAMMCTTSPFYRHITMKSLFNAPLVRDTLPPDAKERSVRKASAKYLLVKTLAERDQAKKQGKARRSFSMSTSGISIMGSTSKRSSSSLSSGSMSSTRSASSSSDDTAHDAVVVTGDADTELIVETTTATQQQPPQSLPVTSDERRSWFGKSTSSLSFFSSSTKSESSSPPRSSLFRSSRDATIRVPPFVDGALLVDHVHEAFTTDDERDTLRGMLLSLQSIGWRRIDVMFDNVTAHEKIIAKRANLAKPLDGGLDVVHHVMDTFLL